MAANSSNNNFDYENWEPESNITKTTITPTINISVYRGRGRARGIRQEGLVNISESRGRGRKKEPYSGPIVIKFKLEPVRPAPVLSLTDFQKSILVKKKHTMNEIHMIQNICGKSPLNPFAEIREFKRKQQHANTRDYPLPESGEFKRKVESSSFRSFWKTQNPPIQNINDKSLFWIDSTPKYWFAHRILSKEKVLFMDTEGNAWDSYCGFMCLIQVSTRHRNFIFDCIQIPQLIESNMKTILENPFILKVFHGCGQDIRWFQRDFGIFVFPVLDTQVLPAPVGPEPGKVDSFSTLVNKVLEIPILPEVKPLGQLSDYRCRPLHPDLMLYALDDSRLLLHIYETVKNKVNLSEAYESTKKILHQSIYDGTKSAPNPNNNNTIVDKLKLWREEKAKSFDVKPQYIASDPVLVNAASGKNVVKPMYREEVWKVIKGEAASSTSKGTIFCFRCGNSGCIAISCKNEKLTKAEVTKRYYEIFPEKREQEKQRKKNKSKVKRNAITAGSYYKS